MSRGEDSPATLIWTEIGIDLSRESADGRYAAGKQIVQFLARMDEELLECQNVRDKSNRLAGALREIRDWQGADNRKVHTIAADALAEEGES